MKPGMFSSHRETVVVVALALSVWVFLAMIALGIWIAVHAP